MVAKGFTQAYGIDHPRNFFAVAKLNSALLILCIAANFSLSLHWLKVKNAFLNCDIQEEYEEYMDPHSGFTSRVKKERFAD